MYRTVSFAEFLEEVRIHWPDARESPIWGFLTYFVLIFVAMIGYAPAILLRISFKSASFIYLPLIWIAHLTVGNYSQLKYRAKRYKESEIEKLRRWVSYLVMLTLVLKYALVRGLVEPAYVLDTFKSQKIVDTLFSANPFLEVALALEATLTMFIYYYSDALLARLEFDPAAQLRRGHEVITSTTFLRGFLGIIIVLYGLTLAAGVVLAWQ